MHERPEGHIASNVPEELGRLSVGQTAVDDLDGNRLLWALGGLAYQLFHLLRSRLPGTWRVAQPKWLRMAAGLGAYDADGNLIWSAPR